MCGPLGKQMFERNFSMIINRVRRHLSWHVARLAYKYVKIEPRDLDDLEEEKEEDEDKEETPEDVIKKEKNLKKMTRLALKSNLLSGGISFDHLPSLLTTNEAKHNVKKYAEISQDRLILDSFDK